jgi:hypothetical protein
MLAGRSMSRPNGYAICMLVAGVLFVMWAFSGGSLHSTHHTVPPKWDLNERMYTLLHHNPTQLLIDYPPCGLSAVLFIGVMSCRSLKCAQRRHFLRTESWPSLLPKSPLFLHMPFHTHPPLRTSASLPDDGWRRSVSYGFVIGAPPSAEAAAKGRMSTAEELEQEQATYSDLIVLNDASDDYLSLTGKTRALLRWMDESDPDYASDPMTCHHTPKLIPRHQFYMKADDDVFLNLPYLVAFLRSQHQSWAALPSPRIRGRLLGKMQFHAPVDRRPGQLWADPTFPTDTYPPYPSGPGL